MKLEYVGALMMMMEVGLFENIWRKWQLYRNLHQQFQHVRKPLALDPEWSYQCHLCVAGLSELRDHLL